MNSSFANPTCLLPLNLQNNRSLSCRRCHRLEAVRDQLLAEKKDGTGAGSEELQAENAALKKEISQLKYRVNHLVRELTTATAS
jgi:hypothetical protein